MIRLDTVLIRCQTVEEVSILGFPVGYDLKLPGILPEQLPCQLIHPRRRHQLDLQALCGQPHPCCTWKGRSAGIPCVRPPAHSGRYDRQPFTHRTTQFRQRTRRCDIGWRCPGGGQRAACVHSSLELNHRFTSQTPRNIPAMMRISA